MKKAFLLLSLLCCFIIILSGCSTSANAENQEPTEYQAVGTQPCVYSIQKNLPEGYRLFLSYLELEQDELDEWNRKVSDAAEIFIYKGEEIVFRVSFVPKRFYESKLEYARGRDGIADPGHEELKILKEVNGEEQSYLFYHVTLPEKIGPSYYRFLGTFNKSEDCAFWIAAYTSEEEAETLFKALDLQFLHE